MITGLSFAETPVSKFLDKNGGFDLESARRAGFQGSLNLEGYDVRIDPVSGKPLISPASVSDTNDDPDDQYWHDLTVPDVGMDDIIHSLTVYNGELIAGGYFTTAGGVTANYIARWDGSSWQPLGSGTNSAVISLTVYNGELIAGGFFTTAGGVAANYIARWNGSTWQPLGSGRDNLVISLTVFNGELIAGGWNSGFPIDYSMARWDGSTWQ